MLLTITASSQESVHQEFEHHPVFAVKFGHVFNTNQTLSFCCSRDTTLKCWDISTGKEIHSYGGHTGTVTSLLVLNNAKGVFSSSLHILCMFLCSLMYLLNIFILKYKSSMRMAVEAVTLYWLSGTPLKEVQYAEKLASICCGTLQANEIGNCREIGGERS